MRFINATIVSALLLATCGCRQTCVIKQERPDWSAAEAKLLPAIQRERKRDATQIMVQDRSTVTYQGWCFTWAIQSVDGTNVILKRLHARPIE